MWDLSFPTCNLLIGSSNHWETITFGDTQHVSIGSLVCLPAHLTLQAVLSNNDVIIITTKIIAHRHANCMPGPGLKTFYELFHPPKKSLRWMLSAMLISQGHTGGSREGEFFVCELFLKSLVDLFQYCFCFMFCFFGNQGCGILAS